MNTKVLEYISAIAEEQSVSRAAERFYLSHPALSGHLKKLEQELGAQLFQRTAKGMRPTPEGLIFLADARAILHLEQQLSRQLAAMRQQNQRVIRVMVDMAFYNRFVKSVIPRFARQQPEDTVEIRRCGAAEACRELRRGEAALGVFFSSVQHSPELIFLPFYSSQMRLVFPKGYAGNTGIEGLRSALDGGMLFSQYPTGSSAHDLIQKQLDEARIRPVNTLEGETHTIIGHVIAGNACCAVPEYFCSRARQEGLTVGDAFCPIHHVLAYSPLTPLPPAVQELMQIIIEEFSALNFPSHDKSG